MGRSGSGLKALPYKPSGGGQPLNMVGQGWAGWADHLSRCPTCPTLPNL